VAPALVLAVIAVAMLVIAVVLIAAISLWRRHDALASEREDDESVTSPAEHLGDAAWQQRMLAFAVELRASLTTGQLLEIMTNRLPALLGVERVWIETTIGGRRKLIASPVAGEDSAVHPLTASPGAWTTFPLLSTEGSVGVIGVPAGAATLTPAARRAMATLAPLLGDSLQTAHTIAHLRELSTIDPVTGCSTRLDGLERLRAELKRAQRAKQQVAVLMLDLDYFKSVNDRYGHQCGDAVLAAIGHTIMQTLRVSDVRCRWGGEEFLVALPESGLDQATRVGLTLARSIAGTTTECDSAPVQLTTSVGITIALPGEEDVEAVLARADAALYRAKADGRNCIRVVLAQHGERSIATVPAAVPLRDRRNPEQPDRRQYRGPGRRTTDDVRSERPRPTDAAVVGEARARATPA
jgi:diguanylate cyclase (GGDEF)-like protein